MGYTYDWTCPSCGSAVQAVKDAIDAHCATDEHAAPIKLQLQQQISDSQAALDKLNTK